MRLRPARLASLVLCVAAAGCAGPSAPTTGNSGGGSGSGSNCRIYPARSTVTVQSSNLSSSSQGTCTWDANLHQLTCQISANGGGQVCVTTVSSFNTQADFVDEIRVIPPALLRTADVQTSDAAPACPVGALQNTAYVYDAQRRLTQIVSGPSTTTYTAWDSSGRPTQGNLPAGTPVTIAYDSAARKQTQTTGAGDAAVVVTTTFDPNGTPIQVVTVNAGVTTTVTTLVTSTAQVCK